ncbi:MAG: hypothetical protein LBP70_02480 [Mycoplasmataceae bacterium]|jgi:hypothetical protein|nr:hypothetical protein [Mycoplasmataceae bacterium]
MEITSKEILEMSETEWQAFRKKSWERKREYYAQNVPDWYLRDQENFAKFLESKQTSKKKN